MVSGSEPDKKRPINPIVIAFVLLALGFMALPFLQGNQTTQTVPYSDFKFQIEDGKICETFILGQLSARSPESLDMLRNVVSCDHDWCVQEILAKAFDRYCEDSGYQNAVPVIEDWLADPSPNIRRSITEGLQIWTGRPYFDEHPDVAIRLLS